MEYEINKCYKTIKDWREDDRPRERLQKHGAHTLSDAELLAILINSGSRGFSAVDAAKELLEQNQTLAELSAVDLSRIMTVKGIGNARAVTLAAAFEIAKRINIYPIMNHTKITGPDDVANYLIPRLLGLKKEIFRTLLLNSSNKIFRDVVISEGTLNESIIHPREVFKTAVSESAASIIIAHNHPSGNTQPSKDDIEITEQLVEAGHILCIEVLDHVIIANGQYFSFKNEGLI